jgi:ATP-dependent DNA ligase
MAASRNPRLSLFAFDLLELGGKDLGRTPLEERKGGTCQAGPQSLLGGATE